MVVFHVQIIYDHLHIFFDMDLFLHLFKIEDALNGKFKNLKEKKPSPVKEAPIDLNTPPKELARNDNDYTQLFE